ncbi:CBS domain-containing protein [Chloroflexota bacterium]
MKTIIVSEVYKLHGTATDTISEDTSLEHIISRFAWEPGLRGIFLIDARQKLSGIVTRADLLKWAHFQLYGGKGRYELGISEFFRIADAKKAKDLARRDGRSLGIKETDSLQTALDKMLDVEEDVLPVIDNQGKILGDLRLSEVLLKVIEVGKQVRENNRD